MSQKKPPIVVGSRVRQAGESVRFGVATKVGGGFVQRVDVRWDDGTCSWTNAWTLEVVESDEADVLAWRRHS